MTRKDFGVPGLVQIKTESAYHGYAAGVRASGLEAVLIAARRSTLS
jgi:hypothetical protein